MLNVMRIYRLTDVQSDCKNASQVSNASKMDISECIYVVENLNSLPNSVDIVTRQDPIMWVISYMTNIALLPAQHFIQREAH